MSELQKFLSWISDERSKGLVSVHFSFTSKPQDKEKFAHENNIVNSLIEFGTRVDRPDVF